MGMKNFLMIILMTLVGYVAAGVHFESGERQVSVLELYTSEGCSSCPPADNWLSKLVDHPRLFKDFVPLAFHVDYWDYIGWRDEFAKPEYGQRQTDYYQQGGISSRWTPQLIRNGKSDRRWKIPNAADDVGEKVGKLSVDVVDGKVYIAFLPTKESGELTAHIALLGFGFENFVTAGENEDRKLKHDFVVLKHAQKSSKTNRWSMPLPNSKKSAKRVALAVWVSKTSTSKPIQIIANYL